MECLIAKRRREMLANLGTLKQKNPPCQTGTWLSFNRRGGRLLHRKKWDVKIQSDAGEDKNSFFFFFGKDVK